MAHIADATNQRQSVEQYRPSYAPYSSIYAVSYYILSSEENRLDSTVEIENKDLFHGDLPAESGIHDSRMGTTDKGWRCGACGLGKGKCPGHSGHINLNYPVKNPLWRKDSILKFLKVICFRCGRLIVTKEVKVSRSRRLMEFARIVTADKINKCPYEDCQQPHPTVVIDKADPAIIYAERTDPVGKVEREEIFNHIIKEIFSRISDETVEGVGWVGRSHPSSLMLDAIRIMPNTARPYIKRQTGNRINSSDDITTLTKQIMEINMKLPKQVPDLGNISKNLRELYGSIDMLYFEMIKGATTGEIHLTGSSGKSVKSIAQRIDKKEGRLRKTLLGKRGHGAMRSVLTCDPSLEVDQVGVPMSIAKGMQIYEVVRPYNKKKLEMYFNNKQNIHPGCTHVWKKNRGEKYLADKVSSLEIGDIIYRDIIDGDIIAINRQPSLMAGSILGMRVVITTTGESLRINESACMPINADFDGDAVNGLLCQNIQARVELEELSELKEIFINRQNHTPYFGCFQDSLVGTAQLTRSHIKINKWHAMMMFSNILLEDVPDISFDKNNYRGRELIGRFLPKINYPPRSPHMYNEDYAPFIEYDKEEIIVEVNRGELVSGILDKKSVGQGKAGTLLHIINNEYGSRRALDTLHNFHQIIMKFFLWNSATVGIKDILLPDHAIEIIHEKTKLIIDAADKLTEIAHRRELIAPIGTPLNKYYESEVMTKLSLGDEFIEPIYNNIDTNEGIMQLVLIGSKGDQKNMMAIYGAIGQMTIGTGRQPMNFGCGRTSPYFLRGDRSPRANGFIDNSYREGVSSDIFAFIAAEARYNEIMKALSTSVAGAQGRICTRNIESIFVGNFYNSVKKDAIIQLLYADSGIDPAKVESVKFLTAMVSNKALEETYKSKINDFDKIYRNKTIEAAFVEEYECIVDDRDVFRKTAFKLHDGNIGKNGLVSNERLMSINPYRIIEDVIFTYKEEVAKQSAAEKRFDPIKAIGDVRQLCKDIAYCYYNRIFKENNEEIPKYIEHSLTLVRILIRSYLCTANLKRKGVTNKLLGIIIDRINKTFKKSLIPYGLAVGVIAAQCISQPQTQYVIDSKLRAGGGGAKTSSLDRIKEIFGAKKTDEMKNTSMIIMLRNEFGNNKSLVQEVANNIEMMNFGRFVDECQIFFETYGKPVHPDYVDEIKMIKAYEKYYSVDIPSNLSKWCLRFVLNKEQLFINGMKLQTIIYNLQAEYRGVLFVHTPENADKIIIRGYLQNSVVKIPTAGFTEQVIIDYMNKMMETIIRGIRGIIYTEVVDISISEIQADGSITSVVQWAIETNGTNLEDVLEHPMVDRYRTQTDSIDEMREMFGVECARLKIINEVQKSMSVTDAATEHAMLIADEMCSSGTVTSIQKTGLQSRDAGNVGLQLAFQAPIQVIEKAASNAIHEIVEGISSNFIYGQVPAVGTTYNEVVVNEPFVEKWYRDHNQAIEDVL